MNCVTFLLEVLTKEQIHLLSRRQSDVVWVIMHLGETVVFRRQICLTRKLYMWWQRSNCHIVSQGPHLISEGEALSEHTHTK